jgi:hypothetical protein
MPEIEVPPQNDRHAGRAGLPQSAGRGTVSLFLPGESFPSGLTGHSERFTDPCPADPSRPERRYVVSDGTIHVLVSGVGPYHLLQQATVG